MTPHPAYVETRDQLPEEAVRVSYSQISTFRQCPQKWYWSYVQGWRPRVPSTALSFGSAWHSVLEKHYGLVTTTHAIQIGKEVGKEIVRLANEETARPDTEAMLTFMYQTYLIDYKLDEQWSIRAVEKRGFVLIGYIFDKTVEYDRPVYLEWVVDLVVYDYQRHGIFIVDHKSTSSLSSEKMLELSDQMPAYQIGLTALKPDLKIRGIMHNESRKPKMKADGTAPVSKVPWHQRVSTPAHSPQALELIRANMLATVALMEEMRSGQREPINFPDENTCGWKCDYLDVHLMTRRGIKTEVAMRDFDMEQKER